MAYSFRFEILAAKLWIGLYGQEDHLSKDSVISTMHSNPCPHPDAGPKDISMLRRIKAICGPIILAQKSTAGNRYAREQLKSFPASAAEIDYADIISLC